MLDMFVGIPDKHLDGCSFSDLSAKTARGHVRKHDLEGYSHEDEDDECYEPGCAYRVDAMRHFEGFKESKNTVYFYTNWFINDEKNVDIICGFDAERKRLVLMPSKSVYKILSLHFRETNEDRMNWIRNGLHCYSRHYSTWHVTRHPELPGHPMLPEGYTWSALKSGL
jgi:hypothetical protein